MPALMFVVPMEQEYDEFTLFFTDGNYIYRLMYMTQDSAVWPGGLLPDGEYFEKQIAWPGWSGSANS